MKIVSHAILSGSRCSPTQLGALGNGSGFENMKIEFLKIGLNFFKIKTQ